MLHEWIPTSGSARGRLVRAALVAFGATPFDRVGVAELASAANTTTGPLYHHFGSKLGLYTIVRDDVEQRVVDRIEGFLAASDHPDAVAVVGALTTAFDYLVRAELAGLLADPHPDRDRDPVVETLAEALGREGEPLAQLITATWRAALGLAVRGRPVDRVRAALARVSLLDPPAPDPPARDPSTPAPTTASTGG